MLVIYDSRGWRLAVAMDQAILGFKVTIPLYYLLQIPTFSVFPRSRP